MREKRETWKKLSLFGQIIEQTTHQVSISFFLSSPSFTKTDHGSSQTGFVEITFNWYQFIWSYLPSSIVILISCPLFRGNEDSKKEKVMLKI